MKIKLFLTKQGEFESKCKFADKLDREINRWLEEHTNIKIVDIRQSVGGGSFGSITVGDCVLFQ